MDAVIHDFLVAAFGEEIQIPGIEDADVNGGDRGCAQPAFVENLPGRAHPAVPAELLIDRHLHPGGADRRDQPPGLGKLFMDWFLAEDMATGARRRDGEIELRPPGDGDIDNADAVVGQHGLKVVVDVRDIERTGQFFGAGNGFDWLCPPR